MTKQKIKVYDNGGKTIDRYTVILTTGDVYTMSHDPSAPQGVFAYFGVIPLNQAVSPKDKEVKITDMSERVRETIRLLERDKHEEATNA